MVSIQLSRRARNGLLVTEYEIGDPQKLVFLLICIGPPLTWFGNGPHDWVSNSVN